MYLVKRSNQILLLAGAFGVGLFIAPSAATADKHSDFKRAAGKSKCSLSPYSGIRSNCRGAASSGRDKAKNIDCSSLGTRGLRAVLKMNERLLRDAKNKKPKDSSRISKLKDLIRKNKRDIAKRKRKAEKRANKAQAAAVLFQRAHTVMGGPLDSRMQGDVSNAFNKARGQSDPGKKAKLMRKATQMSAWMGTIKGKKRSFRNNLDSRRRAAQGARKLCKKAARGDI